LDNILKISLSTDVKFNMSEISFVKKFNHSISNIPLISLYLSHVSDDYGFEVLAYSSKVSITHNFLNQFVEFVITYVAFSKGNL